jgi:hypothetical protein
MEADFSFLPRKSTAPWPTPSNFKMSRDGLFVIGLLFKLSENDNEGLTPIRT